MGAPALISKINGRVKIDSNGCWIWMGSRYRDGYGRISIDGKVLATHRVAYELWVGPIPEGLQLDHLCRVRECCNPKHLEPVTARENMRRSPIVRPTLLASRSACKYGHEFTPENTYLRFRNDAQGPRTYRECRTCRRQGWKRMREAAR